MNKSGKKVTPVKPDGSPNGWVKSTTDLSEASELVTLVDDNQQPIDLSNSPGGGSVTSVNGDTGDVVITGEDLENNVTSVNGDTGDVIIENDGVDDQTLYEYVRGDWYQLGAQTLTNTLEPVIIEHGTSNNFFVNETLNYLSIKNTGYYTVTVQVTFVNSSDGAVVRTGVKINNDVFGGQEIFVDNGTNVVSFTFLLKNPIINDEYSFLVEDDGAGNIEITQGTMFCDRMNIDTVN